MVRLSCIQQFPLGICHKNGAVRLSSDYKVRPQLECFFGAVKEMVCRVLSGKGLGLSNQLFLKKCGYIAFKEFLHRKEKGES